MSKMTTTTMVDGFSRPEAPPGKPKRGIKRPAEPELVLRLQAPKRQCIRERDLVIPSQLGDLREQHRFADELNAIKQNRGAAQKLMLYRIGHFGSGHPLVEPVNVPVELPEETKPVVGDIYKKVQIQNWNKALNATLRAMWRLDNTPELNKFYGTLPAKMGLTPGQRRIRDIRKRKREARHVAAEEARKRAPPPTLEQRKAAKDAAEAERKRLLTTKKSAEEYGILVRSVAKDRMTTLPDFKSPNWALKAVSLGEFDPVTFITWKNPDWEVLKDHIFSVNVCKRVLHLGEETQPVTFFRKEFDELRDMLGEVVERHFGGVELEEELQSEQGWEVLNHLRHPVKLGSLIDAVYDNDGNLMTIACDPKRRTEVIQGVIVRVLRARVWESLLFGGTDKQKENVIHEERRLATDNRIEGFARQKKRSTFLKEELRRTRTADGLPLNFTQDVGYVTQETCNMILPLAEKLRVLGSRREPENMELYDQEERFASNEYIQTRQMAFFADIHTIVHMAAYLALCVRIHPTPIMIDLRTPSTKFEKELDLKCINYDEYRAAKVQLVMEHIQRKDQEAIEMENDLVEAKRRCGTWFDKAFTTVMKGTWRYEDELRRHAWLKGENALSCIPSNTLRWKELFEQVLEGFDTTNSKITPEQKSSGMWYLAYHRLGELQKKMGIKCEDMEARRKELGQAYVETYCGHFFTDIEGKYHREDNVMKREALIRTAVWPSVTLYQPGDGAPGGGNNGMRSWTITKGEVACHCFLPRDKRKRVYNKHVLKGDQLRATLRAAGENEADAKKDIKPDPTRDENGPGRIFAQKYSSEEDIRGAKNLARKGYEDMIGVIEEDDVEVIEVLHKEFRSAFYKKPIAWSLREDAKWKAALEDMFCAKPSKNGLKYTSLLSFNQSIGYLSYLFVKDFHRRQMDVDNQLSQRNRDPGEDFANQYYQFFFTPLCLNRMAFEAAKEEAGHWYDWALYRINNESVRELRANFRRVFSDHERFAGGRNRNPLDDGFWRGRLEEVYGPRGHPETMTGWQNVYAQKYLAFLRFIEVKKYMNITLDKLRRRTGPMSALTEMLAWPFGYTSTSKKLLRMKEEYVERYTLFYYNLPKHLRVDLVDGPLEYDYTRDFITLSAHLNDVNRGYRYLVEYPNAPGEVPPAVSSKPGTVIRTDRDLTEAQTECRQRRFRKHTVKMEAERRERREKKWAQDYVEAVAKKVAERKKWEDDSEMNQARLDDAMDKQRARERAVANAAEEAAKRPKSWKDNKIAFGDPSDSSSSDDDEDGGGDGAKAKASKKDGEATKKDGDAGMEDNDTSKKDDDAKNDGADDGGKKDGAKPSKPPSGFAPEVWNRMSKTQQERVRAMKATADDLKKKGDLTLGNLLESVGVTKKAERRVYYDPTGKTPQHSHEQPPQGQNKEGTSKPAAKPSRAAPAGKAPIRDDQPGNASSHALPKPQTQRPTGRPQKINGQNEPARASGAVGPTAAGRPSTDHVPRELELDEIEMAKQASRLEWFNHKKAALEALKGTALAEARVELSDSMTAQERMDFLQQEDKARKAAQPPVLDKDDSIDLDDF